LLPVEPKKCHRVATVCHSWGAAESFKRPARPRFLLIFCIFDA
jgi:hypothetical protein